VGFHFMCFTFYKGGEQFLLSTPPPYQDPVNREQKDICSISAVLEFYAPTVGNLE